MSAQDDLNAAVGVLVKGYSDLHTALVPALQIIADNANGNAAIIQQIANIQGVSQKMAQDAAALTAAIPAATTVTPPASPPSVDTGGTQADVAPPSIDVPPVTDPNATPPTS
ncbi:hypothetical protein [Bradyrhizobium sp. C9]|uniref:hypothetical protein n=1 Tax=Bradyrhizobium sp. C9 TaxID=142585 RepID=UPI000BE7A847|nr:hypothetical protein [Bradyrhizobium sp. C9]PDT77244.1 hypothetical protein CO675_11950 [Bradyrhizobium sp. C9]